MIGEQQKRQFIQNSKKKQKYFLKAFFQGHFNSQHENNTTPYMERIKSCISRQLKAGCFKSEPLLGMDSQLRELSSWNLLVCAYFGKYSALPKEKGQPQIP